MYIGYLTGIKWEDKWMAFSDEPRLDVLGRLPCGRLELRRLSCEQLGLSEHMVRHGHYWTSN